MDRHLNLFYSYNRDNELIENNLTRAFIVTLRAVGTGARDAILRALVAERLDALMIPCPSFGNAEFALQANLNKERARSSPSQVLLTIATDLVEALGDGDTTRRVTSSIPDAWIIAGDCCFLIEAKVGTNPLSELQVLDHAYGWFGLTGEELEQRHVGLTWYMVHGVIERFLHASNEAVGLNEQERGLLGSLAEYLEYFGYRYFNGIRFERLAPAPSILLYPRRRTACLALGALPDPPSFVLAR